MVRSWLFEDDYPCKFNIEGIRFRRCQYSESWLSDITHLTFNMIQISHMCVCAHTDTHTHNPQGHETFDLQIPWERKYEN